MQCLYRMANGLEDQDYRTADCFIWIFFFFFFFLKSWHIGSFDFFFFFSGKFLSLLSFSTRKDGIPRPNSLCLSLAAAINPTPSATRSLFSLATHFLFCFSFLLPFFFFLCVMMITTLMMMMLNHARYLVRKSDPQNGSEFIFYLFPYDRNKSSRAVPLSF